MSVSNHTFSIFLRDIFLTVSNIITGIIIARKLGPEFFGFWMILMLIPSYAEAFGRIKVDIASVYFIGKKKYNEFSILNNVNSIGSLITGFIILLFLLFFEYIYNFLFVDIEYDLKNYAYVIILQIPIQIFFLNYSYYHLAKENITVYNFMLIIKAITNIILIIIFLLILDLNILGVIISLIISTFCGFLYGFINSDLSKIKLYLNISECKDLISYSLNFYFSGILAHFNELGVRTLAVIFVSPVQIGFLALGQNLSKLLNRINDALNSILFSRISKSNFDSAKDLTIRSFRMISIIIFISGIIFFILIKYLIIFMYGVEFLESTNIVKIIIPGVLIYGSTTTIISFFNGIGMASTIPKIQIIPILFHLVLAYFLMENYGIEGGALAYSLGLIFYSLLLIRKFIVITESNLKDFIPKFEDFILLKNFINQKLKLLIK